MTHLRRTPPPWPALTLVALALAALPARPQGLGGQLPAGMATVEQVKAEKGRADKLAAALAAKDAELKAALARAKTAEAAAQGAPAGVPPEQLEAARSELKTALRQRDAALAEVEDLKRQLAQAQTTLKRAQAAAGDDAVLRAERDRLRRDNAAQQERVQALSGQLAQAQAAARPAPVQGPVYAPAKADATAMLADRSELSVPGCGAACPSFIVIPNPGRVLLGSGDEEIVADFRHRFAIGKTEVTVGQWKAFWNAADRDYQPVKTSDTYCNWNDQDYARDDRHPVRCVNVADAEAYARWFARRYADKLGVRVDSIGLPTDLEWEFSARGGRYTQQYLWDDGATREETCRHAQTAYCQYGPIPVASRLKNGYDLHDMIGNVLEWTASPWRDRKAIPANGRDAAGVSAPRAVRGASFFFNGVGLRLASRYGCTPGVRSSSIGFRLVARIAP